MSTLHRQSDWEDRLRTYLDRVTWEPFKWGTHDCALFAADAVNAMCGVDPAAAFRNTYGDRRGAAQALRDHGAGTLLATVGSWFAPASVHHAKRGDIVMLDRRTTGICVGRYSWFIGTPQGLDRLYPLPTASCQYAFSVPFGPVPA